MNELIQLASDICETPISLVSFLNESRQVVMSSVGTHLTETPLDVAFCAYTVAHADLLVVEDAACDERFKNNPLVVGEPHIRFYAGVPLHWPDGQSHGALCVIDSVARKLTKRQEHALRTLGHQVELRFELEARQERLERSFQENADMSAKLQESNNMFSAFMSHTPFLCYIKDAEGRFLFYNRNCAEQFQVTEQAWLGLRDHDLFPKELADEFRRHDLEAMSQGRMLEIFERTPGLGQDYVEWKSYKFPIPRADGEVMAGGISIDFTKDLERESRLMRAANENLELSRSLEASKNLLQEFLDNAPYQTCIRTTDGKFTSYNRKFAEYYGITQTEWIGQSVYDFFPQTVAASYGTEDEDLLRRGEPITTIYKTMNRSGEERTFRATKFLLLDADGRRLIGEVSYDISAEAELEAQRGRLAALGMMAGGIAHEINNPLAIIHMAAADLVDGLGCEALDRHDLMHCAKDVLQTSMRIKKIIESMRTMSRDGSKDKPTVCAAQSIVEETLDLCRQRFRASPVRLDVVAVDPALRIACQQAQLGQVLLNLVMNAYDAAAECGGPGWVRVEAGGQDAWVVFSVTDSGAGVPQELQARIMEPFFTTKEVGKGTGLGLSISRAIVAEHGGTLKLSNESGNTCFSFGIPRIEGRAVVCN